MAVVALLALFGADEHLLDLADPAIRRLPVGLLRHRPLLIKAATPRSSSTIQVAAIRLVSIRRNRIEREKEWYPATRMFKKAVVFTYHPRSAETLIPRTPARLSDARTKPGETRRGAQGLGYEKRVFSTPLIPLAADKVEIHPQPTGSPGSAGS